MARLSESPNPFPRSSSLYSGGSPRYSIPAELYSARLSASVPELAPVVASAPRTRWRLWTLAAVALAAGSAAAYYFLLA